MRGVEGRTVRNTGTDISETRETGKGNGKEYPHDGGDDDNDDNASYISLHPYPWSENKLKQEKWRVKEINLLGGRTQ